MGFAFLPPSRWRVTLADGSIVDVWADGYTGGDADQKDYEFSVIIDLDPDDETKYEVSPDALEIRGGAVVTVARFPRASVGDINSA
ncbi:hypothetical protein [Nocardioides sp.]|uniref:hypothetical protein n=1 Tax=Nocardioides sp. TaxID=35761 RepID=UPI002CA32783|nr:hypothetical protein [Nocardioides sp.]HXH80793.1 hypothetical protein [Nocardioides sp.]